KTRALLRPPWLLRTTGLSGFRTCPGVLDPDGGPIPDRIPCEHRERDEEHRDSAPVRGDDRAEEEDRDRRETPVLLPELGGHDPERGQSVHEHRELEREAERDREQQDEVDEAVAVQDQKVRAEEMLDRK